ncbi:thymidylate synthase (FAD) [candidate division WWE3 bacterium CG10_big_fil_rev_8_21_14_0_10_32_10]|uniref:Flavin-dependent thymidylate synthase n=1 Tax=candidate division WWE3 bacterium CG10_big_fil_rev_8_21_14_0_10_32_10 TaxID=1975090 RepID=A0A2H0RAH5_UNCKA|nr:MAG: thymidylate synthase (FAD) [candidate division WWE3 bacterium CG10_big_fil_rev_8_21_14_0_10_32_10]
MKVLGNGYVELLESMGDDLAIVNAARKSFDTESKEFSDKDRKLLRYMWDNKHTSPFEMVEFKFAVKAPLFVVRQWQRHRTWSYNEVSRRYTSNNLDFHIPAELRFQSKENKQASSCETLSKNKNNDLNKLIRKHIRNSITIYNKMIDEGVCREQARMVLPQNMMVEMVAKVDLSNLIKFLKLRNHPHAQLEIQEYAREIENIITQIVPETMKLYYKSNAKK